MYIDNPYYASAVNLQQALYHNNPVRYDIAGSVDDIMSIDVDTLKKTHKTFYTPANMSLVVCGDINCENIAEMVDKSLAKVKKSDLPVRIKWDEPAHPFQAYTEAKMQVSMPLFNIGFKDDNEKYAGIDRVRRDMAGTIMCNMLFGPTSEFYERLYNEGLINQSFGAGYEIERDYAMLLISGESENIEKVIDEVKQYIRTLNENGLDEEDFNMIRNSMEGEMIKAFNSPEAIGKIFGRLYLQGINGFDYFLSCGTITFQEVIDVFKSVLLGDMAISVIYRQEDER